MPEIKVTLSANAGVCVSVDNHNIWVDALHEQKQLSFSAVTPELQNKMLTCKAFFNPEHICFTHCHGDHYSRRLTAVARALWPNGKVYLPELEFEDQILPEGDCCTYRAGDLTLQFVRLPHEGEMYRDVKHYGIMISTGSCNILFAGDCEIASPVLAEAIKNISIDLAVLDFPWATLRKGRAFLVDTLKAKHVLLFHIPFEQDDTQGYRPAAKQAVDSLKNQMDIRLLWEPLQTEQINI